MHSKYKLSCAIMTGNWPFIWVCETVCVARRMGHKQQLCGTTIDDTIQMGRPLAHAMTNSENENELKCVFNFFSFENDMLPWHTKCWQPQMNPIFTEIKVWWWWWTISLVYTFAKNTPCFCMHASFKWTVNMALCIDDVGESRSSLPHT